MATVELTWTDNSSNEDGFNIYRTTTDNPAFPGDYTQIDTAAADATSYTDTSAPDEDQVYYAVTAYNADGESSETTDDVITDSLIDSFEDQDFAEYNQSNTNAGWGFGTDFVTEGTYGIFLDGDNTDTLTSTSGLPNYPGPGDIWKFDYETTVASSNVSDFHRFSQEFAVDTGTGEEYYVQLNVDSGSMSVWKTGGGNNERFGVDFSVSYSANTHYSVELTWDDSNGSLTGTADRIEATLVNEDTDTEVTTVGGVPSDKLPQNGYRIFADSSTGNAHRTDHHRITNVLSGAGPATDAGVITSASASPRTATETSTAADGAGTTTASASPRAATETSTADDAAGTTTASATPQTATETSSADDGGGVTSASAITLRPGGIIDSFEDQNFAEYNQSNTSDGFSITTSNATDGSISLYLYGQSSDTLTSWPGFGLPRYPRPGDIWEFDVETTIDTTSLSNDHKFYHHFAVARDGGEEYFVELDFNEGIFELWYADGTDERFALDDSVDYDQNTQYRVKITWDDSNGSLTGTANRIEATLVDKGSGGPTEIASIGGVPTETLQGGGLRHRATAVDSEYIYADFFNVTNGREATGTDAALLTESTSSPQTATETSTAAEGGATTSASASVLSSQEGVTDAAGTTTASASPQTATETAQTADSAGTTSVSASPQTATETATSVDNGSTTGSSATPQTAAETSSADDGGGVTSASAITLRPGGIIDSFEDQNFAEYNQSNTSDGFSITTSNATDGSISLYLYGQSSDTLTSWPGFGLPRYPRPGDIWEFDVETTIGTTGLSNNHKFWHHFGVARDGGEEYYVELDFDGGNFELWYLDGTNERFALDDSVNYSQDRQYRVKITWDDSNGSLTGTANRIEAKLTYRDSGEEILVAEIGGVPTETLQSGGLRHRAVAADTEYIYADFFNVINGREAKGSTTALLTDSTASPLSATETSTAAESGATTSVAASPRTATETGTATEGAGTTTASASPQTATETAQTADSAGTTSVSASPQTATETATSVDNGSTTGSSATPQTATETSTADGGAGTTAATASSLSATETGTADDGAGTTTASASPQTATETSTADDGAGTVGATATALTATETTQTSGDDSGSTTSASASPQTATETSTADDGAAVTNTTASPLSSEEGVTDPAGTTAITASPQTATETGTADDGAGTTTASASPQTATETSTTDDGAGTTAATVSPQTATETSTADDGAGTVGATATALTATETTQTSGDDSGSTTSASASSLTSSETVTDTAGTTAATASPQTATETATATDSAGATTATASSLTSSEAITAEEPTDSAGTTTATASSLTSSETVIEQGSITEATSATRTPAGDPKRAYPWNLRSLTIEGRSIR